MRMRAALRLTPPRVLRRYKAAMGRSPKTGQTLVALSEAQVAEATKVLNEEILPVRRCMHAPGKRYPACVPGATPGIPGIVIMYGRGEGGIIVDDRGWGLVRALAPGLCEVAAVWPWHGAHDQGQRWCRCSAPATRVLRAPLHVRVHQTCLSD